MTNRFDGTTIYPGIPDYIWVQDDSRTWYSRAGMLDCLAEIYRGRWQWTILEGWGQGDYVTGSTSIGEGNGYPTAVDAMNACERFVCRELAVSR